jgi:hypothetical protein
MIMTVRSGLIILSSVGAGHARDHFRNRGHGPLLLQHNHIDTATMMAETMIKPKKSKERLHGQ